MLSSACCVCVTCSIIFWGGRKKGNGLLSLDVVEAAAAAAAAAAKGKGWPGIKNGLLVGIEAFLNMSPPLGWLGLKMNSSKTELEKHFKKLTLWC